MKSCVTCRDSLPDHARFCRRCGAVVRPRSGGTFWALSIALALAAVLALGLMVVARPVARVIVPTPGDRIPAHAPAQPGPYWVPPGHR
jgi:hypothetical protein